MEKAQGTYPVWGWLSHCLTPAEIGKLDGSVQGCQTMALSVLPTNMQHAYVHPWVGCYCPVN